MRDQMFPYDKNLDSITINVEAAALGPLKTCVFVTVLFWLTVLIILFFSYM